MPLTKEDDILLLKLSSELQNITKKIIGIVNPTTEDEQEILIALGALAQAMILFSEAMKNRNR